MENEIRWIAGNGAEIVAKVIESNSIYCAVVEITINGQLDITSRNIPSLMASPMGAAIGRIGKVGLTQERWDALQAMLAAKQAEIDARPEVQAFRLREKAYDEKISGIAKGDAERARKQRELENYGREGC
jgi:hypothetical protein